MKVITPNNYYQPQTAPPLSTHFLLNNPCAPPSLFRLPLPLTFPTPSPTPFTYVHMNPAHPFAPPALIALHAHDHLYNLNSKFDI